MKKLNLTILITASLLVGQSTKAQGQTQDPNPNAPPVVVRTYEDSEYTKQLEATRTKVDVLYGNKDANGMMKQPPEPSKVVKKKKLSEEEIEEMKNSRKEWEKLNKRLLPSPIFYSTYQKFLSEKNTGLMRLFVDNHCDEGMVVTPQELERCADEVPIKGGGSYYSFRGKVNYGFKPNWWDIHFDKNKLIVGNETVLGILSNIGSVKLEDINLDSTSLDFLVKYKPKNKSTELSEEQQLLEKGINFNGFNYLSAASAEFGHTYILRSVAYSSANSSEEEKTIRTDRLDIIITFKIVGQETDGSLVILWKKLKEEDAPRLKK